MGKFIEWLEEHMLSCAYKKYLGIECPGCGLQRAFVELLKGDFFESIKMYPPLIPMLFMFVFLALHLAFGFKNGAKYLKMIFIINAGIIFVNYIIRLFA